MSEKVREILSVFEFAIIVAIPVTPSNTSQFITGSKDELKKTIFPMQTIQTLPTRIIAI